MDLINATIGGDVELVGRILSTNVNVNFQDQNGYTALMYAATAKTDNPQVMNKLILANANLNLQTRYEKETALIIATIGKNLEAANILLDNGANVNIKDTSGRTALIWAADMNFNDVIIPLLQQSANIDEKDNDDGFTALMWATFKGYSNVVKTLLEQGANVNEKDNNDKTAFNHATNRMIKDLLIEYGSIGNLVGVSIVESPTCPICHDKLFSKPVVETTCKHQFHAKCLHNQKKINRTCPLCRQPDAFFGKSRRRKPRRSRVKKC